MRQKQSAKRVEHGHPARMGYSVRNLGAAVMAAKADIKFELARFVPFRLSLLTGRISGVIARAHANAFKLQTPEWRILAILGRFGEMAPGGVAEYTAMDKARVSRTVTSLMTSGLVLRGSDPFDRRRAFLRLTARGQELYAAIVPLVLAAEAELFKDLTDVERATLEATIAKLEHRLDEARVPRSEDD